MRSEKLKLLIFCNLILLFYALHYWVHINRFVLSLLINLMIFVIPGLAWVGIFRKRVGSPVSLLFYVICISISILILGIGGHLVLGIRISSASQLLYLALATNIGILASRAARWESSPLVKNWKKGLILLVPFHLLYGCLYYGATSVVPPLEDHDLVTQSTAYGINKTLKPFTLTDRMTPYDFDHPPLSRFYHAQAFLFSGCLDDVKYYYETALTARNIEEAHLQEGMKVSLAGSLEDWEISVPDYQIVEVNNDEITLDRDLPEGVPRADRTTIKDRWLRGLVVKQYQRFFDDPRLLETRMPNLFFSALTGIVIFSVLSYLTRSQCLSLFGVILYFSFPEIFVRSCYGGYMPITNFALGVMFHFCIVNSQAKGECRTLPMGLLLTGIFAGLANHKTIILPLAIWGADLFRQMGLKRRLRDCFTNRAVLGFAVGTVIFWIYGLGIDARTFITDHLQTHFLHRFLHYNVFGYTGYPSVGMLWREFNYNLGIPFLIIGAVIIILSLRHVRQENKDSSILALWFLIGALVFSLIDWRQTKHLMLIVLPLVMAMITFVSRQNRMVRSGLVILLGCVILRNIYVIIRLASDFDLLQPGAGW